MLPFIRPAASATFMVFAMAALALTTRAQPTPATAAPGGGPMVPQAGPASLGPPATMLSPVLAGIISPEEYARFSAFQQQLNDDPALKELNARISGHLKELQRLQGEAHAIREKLVAANPEIKAIRDKLMSGGHARPGTGPMPLPAPASAPAKHN